MIEKINFLLLAPERPIFKQQVEMIILPGNQGNFAVLTHHSPLISMLKTGLIIIHEENKIINQIFVEGGFAQTQEKECRVLVRDYCFTKNIDLEDMKIFMNQKRKQLENVQTQEEKKALERDLHLAHLKMSLISQKSE